MIVSIADLRFGIGYTFVAGLDLVLNVSMAGLGCGQATTSMACLLFRVGCALAAGLDSYWYDIEIYYIYII